ncbi:MAG: lysophospholipid acyltransferase family protein [Myxococcota bacterium]
MGLARAAVNWFRVGARAVVYGAISCALGPLTNRRASRWAMRRWCVGASNALGIRRSIVHADRLDPGRQCVYVANHRSLLDILVLGAYLPGDYRWLAKDAIFRVPFLGWHLRIAGHVPVYRGDKRRRNASLPERLRRVAREGASLLFFPEGTRTLDGSLQSFKLGAFRAAVDEQLPVVPLVVRGTDRLLKKGQKDLAVDRQRACSVTVLEPVPPPVPADASERAHREAAVALCTRVARAMADELGEPVPGVREEREQENDADRPAA